MTWKTVPVGLLVSPDTKSDWRPCATWPWYPIWGARSERTIPARARNSSTRAAAMRTSKLLRSASSISAFSASSPKNSHQGRSARRRRRRGQLSTVRVGSGYRRPPVRRAEKTARREQGRGERGG